MSQFSRCIKKSCQTVVDGKVDKCPVCNGRMQSSSASKGVGWFLAVVGGIITFPMLYVLKEFAPVAMDPEAAVAAGRFGGTADQVPLAVGMLGLVAAFGASMLLFGLVRGITGKRNRFAMPVMLLLGLAMLGLLFYFGGLLPDSTN